MTKSMWAVILVVGLLSGCGGTAAVSGGDALDVTPLPPEVPVAPPPAPALTLGFSVDPPAVAFSSVEQFMIFDTTQVRVVADLAGALPDQAERLELFAPSGSLWFSTLIPLTGATGSDRAVTVLPDGTIRVTYVLEIAGTPIETYNMIGAWRATATLDGTTTTASRTFELR